MKRSNEHRLIAVLLRCYPTRWQSRHGDQARELASALLEDGISSWSIAGSFLGGIVKERVLRKPSVRVGSAFAAFVLGVAAGPLALFALAPAGASSTTVAIVITKPGHAVHQLETAFARQHVRIAFTERPVSSDLVGSILSVRAVGASSNGGTPIKELHGHCATGQASCVDGLLLPSHYRGTVHVTVGVAMTAQSAGTTGVR